MPSFSERSRRDLRPNPFSSALFRARELALPLLDLSMGNPTEVGLGLAAEQLLPLLSHPGLAHYAPEPFGLHSARTAIAHELERAGYAVPAQRIMLTASTSEAYAFLFKLLCDPGDSLLVPLPSYPLLEVLAALEGVRLLPYRLAYDGEWHLDRASVEQALEERVRAVVCVHPNNPTGSFLKRDELAFLAELGLPIISDEVFAQYAWQEDPARAPSALDAGKRTLVFQLSGLSKSLALPQLKLAFTAIAGPEALAHEACARLEHIADAYLSPSSAVQLALPQLLAHGPSLRTAILERVRRNRAVLEQTLADCAANALRCEGGWYAIVRLPELLSDEDWCLRLLQDDGLVVQPGYFFDLVQGAYVVLSLITAEANFATGITRLRARVDAVTRP
jgi:aspartate/methionine/tyrosine aminotransferase